MNKSLLGALVLALIVGVIGVAVLSADSDEVANTVESTTSEVVDDAEAVLTGDEDDAETVAEDEEAATGEDDAQEATETTVAAITMDEIATHNSAVDCWTYIDGTVYDITEYVPRHPGGESILNACGADGTSLFNERTTTDGQTIGSGTAHSSNAAAQLEAFEIGELAN